MGGQELSVLLGTEEYIKSLTIRESSLNSTK